MEEFVWCKLYIMQRDHCDWTDLFNVLYERGAELDWDHLTERLGEDWPLLKGALAVYGWLCPNRVGQLPVKLWERLEMKQPLPGSLRDLRRRIRLLDSRRWFAALQSQKRKLEA
jgi:hypothetical protein